MSAEKHPLCRTNLWSTHSRDTCVTLSRRCLAPVRGSYRHGLSDEAELRHLVQLPRVVRELEEGHQAGALARTEAVAQLLEVPREETGRIAITLARLVGEPLGLGAGDAHGRDERILELGEPALQRLRTGPDREDHRQARALQPEPAGGVVRR